MANGAFPEQLGEETPRDLVTLDNPGSPGKRPLNGEESDGTVFLIKGSGWEKIF